MGSNLQVCVCVLNQQAERNQSFYSALFCRKGQSGKKSGTEAAPTSFFKSMFVTGKGQCLCRFPEVLKPLNCLIRPKKVLTFLIFNFKYVCFLPTCFWTFFSMNTHLVRPSSLHGPVLMRRNVILFQVRSKVWIESKIRVIHDMFMSTMNGNHCDVECLSTTCNIIGNVISLSW